MNRICVVLGLLTCTAGPAFGQAVTPPPPPPPVLAPAPPAPPVRGRTIVPPRLDGVFAIPPIELPDFQFGLDVMQNDIRQQGERLRDEARGQADQAREQAFELADRAREQAFEQAQEARERLFELRDFSLAQGPAVTIARGPGGGTYNGALADLDRHQYDRAISRFDQVIAQKAAHADGAMYWKAYAQYKLGNSENALATLADLRRSYAQSQYLADARVLEADVRKSSGTPAPGSANDDQIKLLAISSMQNSNPQGAVQLLENVLKATNSLQVKKRALFVLAQNDDPAAHQVLLNYAKGNGNPDLQVEAIRYLTARTPRNGTASARQATTTELQDIYNATKDVDVRRAVLQALMAAGDKNGLLRIASGNADLDMRRQAISHLGSANMMTAAELMQMYQKEDNKELKQTMVHALGMMGAADQLIQIVKTEKDPAVRTQAIRALGNARSERSTQALVELYGSEQDLDVRKSVISSLGSQNNADALIAIARKETNSELKVEIVRRIADMASRNKAAMDFLMEQIK